MKPSSRLIRIGLFTLLANILVMAVNPDLWMIILLLFMMVLILAISDFIFSLPRRLLLIDENRLTIPAEIFIGSSQMLEIRLVMADWIRPTPVFFQLERNELLQDNGLQGTVIQLQQQSEISIQLTPVRRGIAVVEGIWFFWESPYKLFNFRKYFRLDHPIAIYQDVQAVKSAANRLMSRDSFFGYKVLNKTGVGSEFKTMREYQYGMEIRTLDWKQTAKHNKLIAKEYNIESNHNIIMAFDTGYLMSDTETGVSGLDYSINAGLYLSYFALAGGDKVGLFSFDAKPGCRLSPVSGIQRFNAIQYEAGKIDYSSVETNFTLGLFELGKWLNKRSLIILFSDFVDTITAGIMLQNISYLNQKHLVLFVVLENLTLSRIAHQMPASGNNIAEVILADDFLKEKEIVYRKLRSMGVQTLTVSRKNMSVALLNKYFEIKQMELI